MAVVSLIMKTTTSCLIPSAEDAFERPSKNAGDSVIPGSPHQPPLAVFPKRTFGQQQRSFCQSWYSKYSWLHYVESTDIVFCYFCMVPDKLKLPISKNKDFLTEQFLQLEECHFQV